jgi:tRNA pseudouridine55 synthase
MDGILNINKPAGQTSFSVVARIRRLSGERRVGHAGTLDPAATGVLPVCLGKATRIIEFLVDTTKRYRAEIELGTTTDTYDSSGQVTHRSKPDNITREHLDTALDSFRGTIQQTPPMYSAIKHQGQPLYKLARAGIEIERKSRPVTIHHLEAVGWQEPVITVEIECSKGTYVRTLAHDLGEALGCGGHLKSLVRTGCGNFNIDGSISMPQLEEAFRNGYWEQFVHPIDKALSHQKAIVVNTATEEKIRQGQPVTIEDNSGNDQTKRTKKKYCRAYSLDGRFLAILESISDENTWQPKKVLM